MNNESAASRIIRSSRELIRGQKYAEACAQLQKLLDNDPKDEDALELLGMAHFLRREMAPARDCFERLTQINPSYTKGWVNLGAILNRMGEHKKAIDSLRRALQRDRKCAEAYYNMGIAQRGMQLNTMAISAYKEAIKLAPDMVDAHINLGNIYMDMKNVGLGLKCFQTALKHNPKSAKAKRCLEKAQSTQKESRKEASPFGRLVNVADLAKQESLVNSRELNSETRLAERETVQKQTKLLRSCAREMITELNETLPQNLHRLKISILHVEEGLDASNLVQKLEQTVERLKEHHQVLQGARIKLEECMEVK